MDCELLDYRYISVFHIITTTLYIGFEDEAWDTQKKKIVAAAAHCPLHLLILHIPIFSSCAYVKLEKEFNVKNRWYHLSVQSLL